MSYHRDFIRQTISNTPGTSGGFTLSTAVSGFLGLVAGDDGLSFDLKITETGVGSETRTGCVYTHATPALTRGTLGTSTTGAAVNFTSAAVVSVVATAAWGNAIENNLGAWGALNGENSITTTATALIGRLNVCTGTTSDYTVTLPAVSGNTGKYIGFRMDAGLTKLVTLDGNASETIDGATTRVMWAQETALLYCNGTTWTKMAGKSRALYCHMAPSSNATLVSGTELKSTMNTTIADNSGRMADTTNYKMTVRRNGNYNVAVSSRLNNTVTNNCPRFLGIGRKNGSGADYTVQAEISTLIGSFAFAYLSIPLALVAGDYFELYGLQISGVNQGWTGDGTTQQSNMSMIEVPQW